MRTPPSNQPTKTSLQIKTTATRNLALKAKLNQELLACDTSESLILARIGLVLPAWQWNGEEIGSKVLLDGI